MNAQTQQEANAVNEADANFAGFSTSKDVGAEMPEYEIDKKKKREALNGTPVAPQAEPQTPFAGFGPIDALPATDAYGRKEPTIGEDDAAAPAVDDETQFLREYLCDSWNQEAIADDAYEAVKHFVVVTPSSETSSLVLLDPVSKDRVAIGTDANGQQAVLGSAKITAAQALSRAKLAMTSDLMRTQGIEQIHGTEMDKALLAIAAHHVGLKIVNKPTISLAVMEQAQAQWEAMMAEAAAETKLDTGAVAVAPVAVTPEAESAPAAAEAPEAAEGTQLQKEGVATVAPEEIVTDAVVEAVDAAPAAADIPVLSDVILNDAEKQSKVSALKDEVKAVLAGSTPNEAVNPEVYVELVANLKAGNPKFADDQGFINVRGITEEFQERGIGAGKARRLVEALKADSIVYDSAQSVPAARTLVNYQVRSAVARPPRVMPQ